MLRVWTLIKRHPLCCEAVAATLNIDNAVIFIRRRYITLQGSDQLPATYRIHLLSGSILLPATLALLRHFIFISSKSPLSHLGQVNEFVQHM